MNSRSRFALKEWAVVCAALAAGRQTILLRKGGIAEGPDGFVVPHPEFWLLPTQFHQSTDQLRPDAARLVQSLKEPIAGTIAVSLYATVKSVHHLDSETLLFQLADQQVLSQQTIRDRFQYRQPGLFLLTLRVYQQRAPHEILDRPEYAGCHSWVELTDELATAELVPVLDDDEFASRAARLSALIVS